LQNFGLQGLNCEETAMRFWQQRKQTDDNITLTQTFGPGEQKTKFRTFQMKVIDQV